MSRQTTHAPRVVQFSSRFVKSCTSDSILGMIVIHSKGKYMPTIKREFVWKKEIDLAKFLADIAIQGWTISDQETYPSGVNELTYVAYRET